MSEKRKLVTPKRIIVAAAAVGILVAGHTARNNESRNAEPREDDRAITGAIDPSATPKAGTITYVLRRGITLRNEPGNPQSICGATQRELAVTVVAEAGEADNRWIQVAPIAGSISVRRAPFDEHCIANPWTNESSLQQ